MGRWRGLLACALLLAMGSTWAQCTSVVTAPAAFGSLNSTQVRSTVQMASSSNSGLQCSGSVLSVLSSTDSFKIKITAPTSGLVGPTGDVIPYTLYADATTSYPITRGTSFEYRTTGILDVLGLLNGTPKNVPLYMRTQVVSNVAAGTYQETLNVEWTWDYCAGIGAGGFCIGRDTGSGSKPLTVSLTVTNDCQITTPDIPAAVAVDFARVVKVRAGDGHPHLLRWRAAMQARGTMD